MRPLPRRIGLWRSDKLLCGRLGCNLLETPEEVLTRRYWDLQTCFRHLRRPLESLSTIPRGAGRIALKVCLAALMFGPLRLATLVKEAGRLFAEHYPAFVAFGLGRESLCFA